MNLAGRLKVLLCVLGCCLVAGMAAAWDHSWGMKIGGKWYGMVGMDSFTRPGNYNRAAVRYPAETRFVWGTNMTRPIHYPFYGIVLCGVAVVCIAGFSGFWAFSGRRTPAQTEFDKVSAKVADKGSP